MSKQLEIGDIIIVNKVLLGEVEYVVTHVGIGWARTDGYLFKRNVKKDGSVSPLKGRQSNQWYSPEYYLKEVKS